MTAFDKPASLKMWEEAVTVNFQAEGVNMNEITVELRAAREICRFEEERLRPANAAEMSEIIKAEFAKKPENTLVQQIRELQRQRSEIDKVLGEIGEVMHENCKVKDSPEKRAILRHDI